MVWNGLPALGAPGASIPDGRTIRRNHQDPSRKISAGIFIPDTNAIESLNSKLRRAIRARGHFPTDEAAMKLLFLVLNRSEKEWTMPAREWSLAKAQFAILFGERFTKAMT
jgi:transposase-like protein